MTGLGYDMATLRVLWWRDLKRFGRQPSRWVGALGQPVIFWAMIGSGMAGTFRLPGRLPGQAVGYLEYFYPGVVVMVALFASIFASVSIIEDRHQGFLQAVLAGPGSRWALVVGKCLGSASVAWVQAGLFLALAPLAGFSWTSVRWPLLAATLAAMGMGLSALGFVVAWGVDNLQAYHAIQMTLLVPLWVVSGAMFPPAGQGPVFGWLMRANPIAYGVAATRHALYGGAAPEATVGSLPAWAALGVVGAFACLCLAVAMWVCQRY